MTELSKRPRAYQLGGLLLFLFVAIGWTCVPFLKPGLLNGETFLFHDNSYSLFTAEQLLKGKILFRDVFFQYGALTAYVHAGWAALFGNTIFSFWRLAQLLTCIAVVQLWFLMRRSQPVWVALLFGVVVLLPYFAVPGGSISGAGASVYLGLERICLLSIALLWTSPASRSVRTALGIGALLGLMQWIKFGGAFVAGASLLVVDLWMLSYTAPDKKAWLRWLKISVITALGFLFVEGILAGLLFAILPSQLASEVLWPSWMVQNYAAYRYKTVSLVHWFNFNYFLGVQLPLLAAAVVALIFSIRLLFKRRAVPLEEQESFLRPAGASLFFVIFFAAALLIYLPHMWVAMTYVWMILLPAVFFLSQTSRWGTGLFLTLCLPAFLVSAKDFVRRGNEGLRAVHLANDTLWLSPELETRMTKLQQLLEQLELERGGTAQDRPAILGFPMGSGFHHFLGYPPATRHAWFMSGFVRPREEQAFVQSLDRTLAVVVFFPEPQATPPAPDPNTWEYFTIPVFTPATSAAIARRLERPIEVDPACWIFPVQKD